MIALWVVAISSLILSIWSAYMSWTATQAVNKMISLGDKFIDEFIEKSRCAEDDNK